jgi:hypothetical protein
MRQDISKLHVFDILLSKNLCIIPDSDNIKQHTFLLLEILVFLLNLWYHKCMWFNMPCYIKHEEKVTDLFQLKILIIKMQTFRLRQWNIGSTGICGHSLSYHINYEVFCHTAHSSLSLHKEGILRQASRNQLLPIVELSLLPVWSCN